MMEANNIIKIVFNTEGGELLIWTKETPEKIQELAEEYDSLYNHEDDDKRFDGAFVDFLDERDIDWTEVEIAEVEVS